MANQRIPGSNPAFAAIYNPSGFDGRVTSDYLRLTGIPPESRKDFVDYSTADFDDFKENLNNYLKAVYPDQYNNFVESDMGQMLVELFAYMAAVLSFKADALAQENYIATAKTRQGMLRLLNLLGIQLTGPVPAKASARLTLQDAAKALTGVRTATIPATERIISVNNTRDNLPLSFTLYKVDANGNVDTQSPDLVLTASDMDAGGVVSNKLLLLEGLLQVDDGTFGSTAANQEISITKPSIIEGSIFVSASDGIYTEIDNIWFASPTSKVFQKRYNEDFSCKLLFGNGIAGKSPVPATDYKVVYRTGGGLRGNIARETLSKTVTASYAVSSGAATSNLSIAVINSRAGTGGQDAQNIEEARRFGPKLFAAQYRAVTGQDYTAFLNSFKSSSGKTGKGVAVLRDNGSAGNMIDLYVLQSATENHLERASYEFKNELLQYMDKYRMLTDHLTVVDGLVRTMDLVTTLYIDKSARLGTEDIKQRVANRITDYFSVTNRDFGLPFIYSDVVNSVLKDPGVRFFKIENFPGDVHVDFNEIIQLNNLEITVEYV